MSAALAAIAVSLALPAWGGQIVKLDPTGGNGVNPNVTINASQLTWAAGNALAIGVLPGGAPPVVGQTFELKYQALLGGISGTTVNGQGVSVVSQVTDTTPPDNGNIITTGVGGVSTGRELTVVADFREIVTGVTTNGNNTVITFGLLAGSPNTLSIYDAAAGTAKNLAGTGFNTGTLILQGTVIQSGAEGTYQSTFSIPVAGTGSPTSPVLFDQYAADYPGGVVTPNGVGGPYPNKLTTSGTGSSFIPVAVSFVNPAFFPMASFSQLTFPSISAALPFNAVSPSMNFTGTTPNLGPINQLSGPDVQFQVQSANDFTVPEPASILSTLTAAALIPSFLYLRRRRSQATAA